MANPTPNKIEELRRQFRAHGQSHVFAFWDQLGDTGRAELLEQASRIGPELGDLLASQRRAVVALTAAEEHELAPVDAVTLPEFGGDATRFETARRRGLEILRQARVAVFVVAGGQGTRLGFSGPKGSFPVGPVGARSLFELQAQKIRGLARRCGCVVPWYVMTSDATDAETRALFERERCFGLEPENVFIFSQQAVPACDFNERLILERAGHISESPNGHGGSLVALASSGALCDMESRGIDRLFYYQVDNPLVQMGDPVYLGFHDQRDAEMSCKVIRKTDPMEKVGVVARIEGRVGLLEYTELADAQRHQRDRDGNLVHWAGNIAIHLFNTDFVRRVAEDADRLLPYHASAKKIPTIDEHGEPVTVVEPNGYKLERFVFDALPAAERVCILEVRPDEEFSPIKNAVGKDSAATARRDLVTLYRAWLAKTGVELTPEVDLVEIDHAYIDSAEEAASAGFQSLAEAGDIVRVATGVDS